MTLPPLRRLAAFSPGAALGLRPMLAWAELPEPALPEPLSLQAEASFLLSLVAMAALLGLAQWLVARR